MKVLCDVGNRKISRTVVRPKGLSWSNGSFGRSSKKSAGNTRGGVKEYFGEPTSDSLPLYQQAIQLYEEDLKETRPFLWINQLLVPQMLLSASDGPRRIFRIFNVLPKSFGDLWEDWPKSLSNILRMDSRSLPTIQETRRKICSNPNRLLSLSEVIVPG